MSRLATTRALLDATGASNALHSEIAASRERIFAAAQVKGRIQMLDGRSDREPPAVVTALLIEQPDAVVRVPLTRPEVAALVRQLVELLAT